MAFRENSFYFILYASFCSEYFNENDRYRRTRLIHYTVSSYDVKQWHPKRFISILFSFPHFALKNLTVKGQGHSRNSAFFEIANKKITLR